MTLLSNQKRVAMSGSHLVHGRSWGRFSILKAVGRRPVVVAFQEPRNAHSGGLIEETCFKIGPRAIVLQTNADHADFFEELREQIILTIQRNARSWFRKDLYRRNIEKMLKPFMQRSRVPYDSLPVRVWCFDGDGEHVGEVLTRTCRSTPDAA